MLIWDVMQSHRLLHRKWMGGWLCKVMRCDFKWRSLSTHDPSAFASSAFPSFYSPIPQAAAINICYVFIITINANWHVCWVFPGCCCIVRLCLEEPLLSVRQFTEVKVLLKWQRRKGACGKITQEWEKLANFSLSVSSENFSTEGNSPMTRSLHHRAPRGVTLKHDARFFIQISMKSITVDLTGLFPPICI